jgi:hypothetical protein
MRLLLGSFFIAASILPAIVHTSGTTFREIFDFSWQYALSPARAEKADRLAMTDPSIDQSRESERERLRRAIDQAEAALRALPLPDVVATLPAVLTSPPELPVELVCDALARAAEETGLPPSFFARLIYQESGFRQRIVSRAGARGVAQFMPETAVQFGLHNSFDPIASVAASGRFLRELFQQFGNLGLAAAAYNAGPRRVTDWLAQRGPMPDETRNYVKTITGQPIEKWTEKAEIEVATHLPPRAPCAGVLGLSRVASAERVPVAMTPAIAKIIDEAKERAAKAKIAAAQAAKEKAEKLAKLKKDKDDKSDKGDKEKSASKDDDGKDAKKPAAKSKSAGNATDKPNLKIANAERS